MCRLTKKQQCTLRGKFIQLSGQNIAVSKRVYKVHTFPMLWMWHSLTSAPRATTESNGDQFRNQQVT